MSNQGDAVKKARREVEKAKKNGSSDDVVSQLESQLAVAKGAYRASTGKDANSGVLD